MQVSPLRASVDHFHLSRHMGGRGIPSLVDVWEREVVGMVTYLEGLAAEGDVYAKGILKYQNRMAKHKQTVISLVMNASKILTKYNLDDPLVEYTSKQASAIVKEAQYALRADNLDQKKIHDVFANVCGKEWVDQKATHGWLRKGRFRGETKALLFAKGHYGWQPRRDHSVEGCRKHHNPPISLPIPTLT